MTTPAAEPTPRAALVYNPVKVADVEALRSALLAESERAGWDEPLLLETTVEDPGQGATREALAADVRVVLVAGGDGTVRAVSEAMNGSGTPLAIVPSGTGNLLARNVRLPLQNAPEMIRAAFEGDRLPTDVGVATFRRGDGTVEEHAFVVMAGIGFDAAMIASTNDRLKKQVGWVAYVDGAARALTRARAFRASYRLDGGHRSHGATVQSILFANCGSLQAGIDLVPGASITDGILDVAVIQPSGPLGWLGVVRKIWWDNSVLRRWRLGRRVVERRKDNTSIRFLRGEGIETALAEPQPVELDGDGFGEAIRVRCRIERGGLLLAVPKGHPTDAL